MPTLNVAPDGHHYILYKRGGRNCTYGNVADKALVFLDQNGVVSKGLRPGNKVHFATSLLIELETRCWVSEIGTGSRANQLLVSTPSYYSEPDNNDAFQLFIEEHEVGWQLVLKPPTIPLIWLKDKPYSQIKSSLSGQWIELNLQRIGATQLMKGANQAHFRVSPQKEPYQLTFSSAWPFDISAWKITVQGTLNTRCTLFDGETGLRLKRLRNAEQGQSVKLGHSYVALVCPATTRILPNAPWPPPKDLRKEFLGRQGEWEAWSFEVPIQQDKSTSEWLDLIGHPLCLDKWVLEVLCPPPVSFTPNDRPVYKRQPVWASASCMSGANPSHPLNLILDLPSRTKNDLGYLNGKTTYANFEVECLSGTHRLRSRIPNQAYPLVWETIDCLTSFATLASNVKPLQVRWDNIVSEDEAQVWNGLSHPPEEVLIATSPHALLPTFCCAAPVNVSWSVQERHDSQKLAASSTIGEFQGLERLNDDLLAAYKSKQPWSLCFDAGTFGCLRFRSDLTPASTFLVHSSDAFHLPANVHSQLEWIAGSWLRFGALPTKRLLPLDAYTLKVLEILLHKDAPPFLRTLGEQVRQTRQAPFELWASLQNVARVLNPDSTNTSSL